MPVRKGFVNFSPVATTVAVKELPEQAVHTIRGRGGAGGGREGGYRRGAFGRRRWGDWTRRRGECGRLELGSDLEGRIHGHFRS